MFILLASGDMPYFDHTMATTLQQGKTAKASGKLVRTMPTVIVNKRTLAPDQKPNVDVTNKYKLDLDVKKLIYMRNLLSAEIVNLNRQRGALKVRNNKKLYKKYKIKRNKVLYEGKNSKFFETTNREFPNHPLCCRTYKKSIGIEPSTALYLKFLRHLGRKHSSIVHTWDLFVDRKKNIEIIQEFCADGNLADFISRGNIDEKEISLYAWQLMRGMDFLGDLGIAHRDIQPRNVVLRKAKEYHMVKITNFRRAIVYWNVEENDIIFLACQPAEQQASDGANYQAPETYGDPAKENFDPIVADTFSYGAVLYFMTSKGYPYNPSVQSENLEKEIQGNIKKLSSLSSTGRKLLSSILCINAGERIPIGHIEKSVWFKRAKNIKVSITVASGGPKAARDAHGCDLLTNAKYSSLFFRNPLLYPEVGASAKQPTSSSSSSSSSASANTTGQSSSSANSSVSCSCSSSANSCAGSTCACKSKPVSSYEFKSAPVQPSSASSSSSPSTGKSSASSSSSASESKEPSSSSSCSDDSNSTATSSSSGSSSVAPSSCQDGCSASSTYPSSAPFSSSAASFPTKGPSSKAKSKLSKTITTKQSNKSSSSSGEPSSSASASSSSSGSSEPSSSSSTAKPSSCSCSQSSCEHTGGYSSSSSAVPITKVATSKSKPPSTTTATTEATTTTTEATSTKTSSKSNPPSTTTATTQSTETSSSSKPSSSSSGSKTSSCSCSNSDNCPHSKYNTSVVSVEAQPIQSKKDNKVGDMAGITNRDQDEKSTGT